MPSDVFISYAREDRETARILAQALETHGWSIWWDRHILPGETWDEVVERELTAARAVIVIWTTHSVRSSWVRAEAGEAMNRGVLIPVQIADVTPPLAFRQFQAADLQAWSGDPRDEGLLQLVDALAALAPASASVEPSRERQEEPVPSDAYVASVPEGEANRISDLYQEWQRERASGGELELAELCELEIRETVGVYLDKLGGNASEADEAEFQEVISIAKRIGLLR